MDTFGPLYCETGYSWLSIAEPINTVTNIFIILAAALALWYAHKKTSRYPLDTMLLIFLLFATGVGSALWHALRTSWALSMDFIPGLLFLLVFAYLWIRKMYGPVAGFSGVTALIGLATISGYVSNIMELPFMFPIFISVLIVGLVLVYITTRLYGKEVGVRALWMLAAALAAATFRTLDLYTCDYIYFGTHFLWHILNPTAAYLAVVLLTRIDATQSADRM